MQQEVIHSNVSLGMNTNLHVPFVDVCYKWGSHESHIHLNVAPPPAFIFLFTLPPNHPFIHSAYSSVNLLFYDGHLFKRTRAVICQWIMMIHITMTLWNLSCGLFGDCFFFFLCVCACFKRTARILGTDRGGGNEMV